MALSAVGGLSLFRSGADFSRLIGGRYADLAIEDGVRDMKLLGIAARRVSDRGPRTQRLGCRNINAAAPMPDHSGAVRSNRWQTPELAKPRVHAGGEVRGALQNLSLDGVVIAEDQA